MTRAVADLVKHIKGTSAHLLAQQFHPDQFFKWQGGYAAFSVSSSHLSRVRDYIAQQREHHAAGRLIAAWELPIEASEAGPPERNPRRQVS